MRFVLILIGFFLWPNPGWAFLPPLSFIMKANFEGRKGLPVETVFKHQIVLPSGDTVSVEERLAEIGGKIYSIFRSPNLGEVGCQWSKGVYLFSSDKRIVGRSRAFNLFFTMNKPESYREVLINEQFLKRELFSQYKSSFVPQGDPALWDLKENYIIHPDIYFARTPGGPAVTVTGFELSGVKKSVSFDKETLILSRLEWKEGGQITSWNFQGFKKNSGDGWFPSELFLNVDNKEMISSSLVSRHYLKDKSVKQWLTRFSSVSQASPSAVFEESLKVLLEYR